MEKNKNSYELDLNPIYRELSINENHVNGNFELYDIILDLTNDSVFIYDFDGNIYYVNKSAYKMLGYSKEELIEINYNNIDSKMNSNVIKALVKNLMKKEEFTYESTYYHKNGNELYVEINSIITEFKGKNIILSISRDITEHKKLGEKIGKGYTKLQKLNTKKRERLNLAFKLNHLKEKLLIPMSLDAKLKMITDGVVEIFNADFARIWMIKKGDLCKKGCIHSDNANKHESCSNHSLCLHLMASSGIYTHTNGDHQRIPLGSCNVGKIATEKESKFITNNAIHDNVVNNPNWARKIGLVSFAGFKLSSKEDKPIGVLALFSKNPLDYDSEILLEDLANTTSQVILSGTAEKELKVNLEEKETLLKETHHRVKNNLTVMSSLLNLQSRKISDLDARKAFKETQNRARSMALIHERLYQSNDLKKINFSEYIQTLSTELFHIYVDDPGRITLQINVEDISVDIKTAIPLGLIINELVTNSLKYAFPDDINGEITIDLHKKGPQYEFIMKDNGIGLPEDFNLENSKSLGLKLINSLTNQINGEIKLDVNNGTKFQIIFP